MGVYGQDWASYQSAAPSTAGLSFAFIKVTEGLGYTNPEWTSQRADAHSAGLVVGLYHYPHMANSPQAEADRFLSIAHPQPAEMVTLDWEGYDPANSNVSRPAQLAYKEAWLRYVKSRLPHNPVGMYCNTDYWNNVDTTGYTQDFLWIATAGRPAGQPGITAKWMFHQYSDQPLDSDYCPLPSTDALHQWAADFASPSQPPVQEDDMLDDATKAEWNSMIWGLKNTCEATQAQVGQLQQQVAAQAAAINTLAGLLSQQHAGVDTAQVVEALDRAIAAAVLKVDVSVTQPPASPAAAAS